MEENEIFHPPIEIQAQWQKVEAHLMPKYYVMYTTMVTAIICLFLGAYLFSFVESADWSNLAKATLAFGLSFHFAFFMQFYTIHFHEASHYNFHPNKKTNDLLATIFITPLIGLPIGPYRRSHWDHHLYLGSDRDTEISYMTELNMWALVKLFTGLYSLGVIARYMKNLSGPKNQANKNPSSKSKTKLKDNFLFILFIFGVTHFLIVLLLYMTIGPFSALAWAYSVVISGPALAYLRQTLEHRASDFSDYNRATNRAFGTSLFAKCFGGAGFNRHILHHWSPKTHFTLFDDYEKFILNSSIKGNYLSSKINYKNTFLDLSQMGKIK